MTSARAKVSLVVLKAQTNNGTVMILKPNIGTEGMKGDLYIEMGTIDTHTRMKERLIHLMVLTLKAEGSLRRSSGDLEINIKIRMDNGTSSSPMIIMKKSTDTMRKFFLKNRRHSLRRCVNCIRKLNKKPMMIK